MLGHARACLGADTQGLGEIGDADPVPIVRDQAAVVERLVGADGDGVGGHILGADIDRCAEGNAQTLALADGVANSALMGADGLAL